MSQNIEPKEEIALILAGLSSYVVERELHYPSPDSCFKSVIEDQKSFAVSDQDIENLNTPHTSPKQSEFRKFKLVDSVLTECESDEKRSPSADLEDSQEFDDVPEWKNLMSQANDNFSQFGTFSCPVCGKSFSRQCDFKSHFRIHMAKRPYECSLCNSRFLRKHDLNRHEKIHSGLKPYACDRCGKGFVRKDALKRHQGMDPAVQKYRCVPRKNS